MEPNINFQPGQRIDHPEFGEGVIVEAARDGYIRVFFGAGERQIPAASASPHLSRAERILQGVEGSGERLRRVRLAYEAHALMMMENAAALTAAKVDLLPHQIVLTHRIATAAPRRFLIADEVGLGKGDGIYEIVDADGGQMLKFTTDRETARNRDDVDLLGLDHIVVQNALRHWAALPPDQLGVSVRGQEEAILTWWLIVTHGTKSLRRSISKPIAISVSGERLPHIELIAEEILHRAPSPPLLSLAQRISVLRDHIEPMLNRELNHQGITADGGGFSSQQIAWVEISSG
jgi:hypothetical protein